MIPVTANGQTFQVAVNIESDVGDSQVLYNIQTAFTPPDASLLTTFSPGIHEITSQGDPAIDYIRSRANGQPIVTLAEMELLPLPSENGGDNLNNAVIQLLNQATADPNGLIYAFGAQYSDGTGTHDAHMNQGNPANSFGQDNGIWQDGAILFYLPASNQWMALFIAFQSDRVGIPMIMATLSVSSPSAYLDDYSQAAYLTNNLAYHVFTSS